MGIKRLLRLRAAFKATGAVGLLAALTWPLPAAAQSIWGGSGSTSATTDYNTATNWSNPPGVAPTSAGTSAVFANTGQGTVNVSAPVTADSWTFATNAQSYAITGALVTFNTGAGLISNASAGQTISIDNSLGGGGGIALNGNSTLTLTAINTYTGATTINSGATLALSGLGGIAFSSAVIANGTFDISGSATPFKAISTLAGSGFVQLGNNGLAITAGSTEFSGTIAGAGSGGVEIVGGTQTLSGVNTYAGVTQVDLGATLALKGNGSIANTLYVGFLSAGTFDISQTKSGASVGGLFDPVGFGKVSLGSKTLTVTGSAGFFNGVIQDGGIGGGTGGNVTIANGGLATLGGVNTYTGFTTINAGGELDMSGNGSIAASKAVINNGIFDISCLCSSSGSITSLSGGSTGVVHLGANTLTITNGSGTYAGAILDSGLGGGFAITGGKEVLTGSSSYTGATTITGATLEMDGSITGTSGVTVNSGGVLSGAGTIDPPAVTINGGATLSPGNAANPFGTLSIAGTLLFNAGSFYAINVGPGAGNNSKTAVVGGATLGGNGTVVVTPQLGNYSGAVYQILTTTTGVTGTFAGLTVNGNFSGSMTLDYARNPGSVDLDISGVSLLAAPPGANQNQLNVLGGINNGILNNPNVPLPPQFLSLGNLSGPSLLNALTQLDGEAATGAERAAFQLTDQFLTLMLDPFVDGRQGRLGAGGNSAIGFAPEQRENLPPDIALAYAAILKKAPPPPTFEQRWTAWGSAFGGSNRANGDGAVGSTNITAQTFGFAAGMDYHVSPNTIAGFALAGAGTNWGLANALGSGRSDAAQAGVYAITYRGPAYLAGALAFTNHWFTTNRTALGAPLSANFLGQSYGARLEGGWRFGVLPTLGVTPYGALQAQDFHTPSYSEGDPTGSGLGLAYNAMNATDVRTELGSRFDAPTLVAGMPLVLRGRLAWAHDFVGNPALGATFQALPGGSFTVNGAPIPHDSALTSAGAELFLTPRWTLLAKFDGEFAGGSQTYAGSGTLRYSW